MARRCLIVSLQFRARHAELALWHGWLEIHVLLPIGRTTLSRGQFSTTLTVLRGPQVFTKFCQWCSCKLSDKLQDSH
ncbi:hypothetical protein BC629DRAFT_1506131 [Irpex lacteus]|nr:hypothetical protein BC629DRAFT_1506131 [Irpex lacteus]